MRKKYPKKIAIVYRDYGPGYSGRFRISECVGLQHHMHVETAPHGLVGSKDIDEWQ